MKQAVTPVFSPQQAKLAEISRVIRELAHHSLAAHPDRIWVALADEAHHVLNGLGGVCFQKVDANHMVVKAAPGLPSLLVSDPFPFSPDSQAAFVMRSPVAVVTTDLEKERRFVPSRLLLGLNIRSSVSCLVGTVEKPLGLVGVFSTEAHFFDGSDACLVESFAATAHIGLVQLRRTQSLEVKAFHDDLTRIPNRSAIFSHLTARTGATPKNAMFAAMMIDLDGFKQANDRHGHGVGDAVLRLVANRLVSAVTPNEFVGRLGGDEFLVITEGLGHDELGKLAERIIGSIEQVMHVDGISIDMSASIGIAVYDRVPEATSLLRVADQAMYKAKASGRGCVVFGAGSSSTAPDPPVPIRPRDPARVVGITIQDVDHAIAQITTVFQPIVRVGSHELVAVEALARGPETSPLGMPDRLFSVTETFGRLAELEIAAKRDAFRQPIPDGISLFVNIDPAVVADDDALANIIDAWKSSGTSRQIVVELTERALVASPRRLVNALERCRDVGWAIALDDVGARAESLTMLRIVRPNLIKLDMQLVQSKDRSHAAAVGAAIAAYCDRFEVEVVAEGVETEAHEAKAEILGATLLQGYRYGRPMPLEAHRLASNFGPPTVPLALRAIPRAKIRRLGNKDRITTHANLMDLTRHIESQGSAGDTVVLAAIQGIDRYTPATRRQYTALARRFGLVGVIGAGFVPGVIDGVKVGNIPEGDDLLRCWHVVLLSSNNSIALLAEETGDLDEAGLRLFRYRLATDASEIEASAHRLLNYL